MRRRCGCQAVPSPPCSTHHQNPLHTVHLPTLADLTITQSGNPGISQGFPILLDVHPRGDRQPSCVDPCVRTLCMGQMINYGWEVTKYQIRRCSLATTHTLVKRSARRIRGRIIGRQRREWQLHRLQIRESRLNIACSEP